MKYYSTNGKSELVDFKEATIKGQAPDKGLYFPEHIPNFNSDVIGDIEKFTPVEIAYQVIHPYVGNSIPGDKLWQIIRETISFPYPLVNIEAGIFSLELFHGPTLAFKDTGARFMSRCLGYFMENESRKVTVLVATSGDTGGAVADGFHNVEGVEVVILYPSGKVSTVQEQQLTTHGDNIFALEISGSFDDCQQMVKQAFADETLIKKRFLTSANSINVARWLPQQFYYFIGYQQWADKSNSPVISVPSGNFGNICAGLMAWRSGLPVKHFIAACNVNDLVPRWMARAGMKSPESLVRPAIPTISNAMDVGNPSNFVRILEMFNNEFPEVKKMLSASSVTDADTKITIRSVFRRDHYVLDPHGAVGFNCLEKYLRGNVEDQGIFLATAHPVKFPKTVEAATGVPVDIPAEIQNILDKPKKRMQMPPHYPTLREYLMQDDLG